MFRRHGQSYSKEYRAWIGARQRCFDPHHADWKDYGGRGITMCDRWRRDFSAFLADMGPRPSGASLDRFPNNDGHYEPDNCRWATSKQQAQNKRNVRQLVVAGQTRTFSEWSERAGVSIDTLRRRLDRGWSPERAVGCV